MNNWKFIAGRFWQIVATSSESNDATSPESAIDFLKKNNAMEDAWAVAKWFDSIGSFEGAAKIRRSWLNWVCEKDESGNFRRGEGAIAKAAEILNK